MIQRCPFFTHVRSPLRSQRALLRVVIQSPTEGIQPVAQGDGRADLLPSGGNPVGSGTFVELGHESVGRASRTPSRPAARSVRQAW